MPEQPEVFTLGDAMDVWEAGRMMAWNMLTVPKHQRHWGFIEHLRLVAEKLARMAEWYDQKDSVWNSRFAYPPYDADSYESAAAERLAEYDKKTETVNA